MFNEIRHIDLKSVLICVNLWLKKTHFSHRFTLISLIFVNLCRQVQRGCA
jgi:hypothetical protein